MYGIIAIWNRCLTSCFCIFKAGMRSFNLVLLDVCAQILMLMSSCVHHHVSQPCSLFWLTFHPSTVTPRTVTTGCFKNKEMWNLQPVETPEDSDEHLAYVDGLKQYKKARSGYKKLGDELCSVCALIPSTWTLLR
jgi:hypothetical protein